MILIDIDMPENCHDCPCFDYEYDECQITKNSPTTENINRRLEDCPLKEAVDENESAIEEMQKNINDMDRELAAIKGQASEKRIAYFEGQRLGYVRAQTYLIEITQRKRNGA